MLNPMTAEQFRAYQIEVVGSEAGAHPRLAALLGTSVVGVKRYATGARAVPDYIAQSLRAMVLLNRRDDLLALGDMC